MEDQVLVADDNQNGDPSESSLKFSKIVSFLHKIEEIDASFLRVYYNYNESSSHTIKHITLTRKHLILIQKANQSLDVFEYKAAYEISQGDSLKYFDYNQKVYRIVKVVKVEQVNLEKSGIYAPLTESGTIIVDNIQVSCYSMVKDHKSAQFFSIF